MNSESAAALTAPPGVTAAPSRLGVVSWALYDLANTTFSMNVLSLYFPLWIVNDLGGRDADYAVALSASQALVFLSAPVLGALSDQARRRMPFLAATTLLCVAFTLFLGVRTAALALVLFAVANYFLQAGGIFYDALLSEVSTDENRGRVGGFGIGLGYLGSFLGVGTGIALTARFGPVEAKPYIFQATALLFLAFALPCFFFVRERQRRGAAGAGALVRAALGQLRQTARMVRRYPGLGRFLVGRVFYTDAANTLTVVMGIYLVNEVGLPQQQIPLVLMTGIASAVAGGLAWGIVVDRVGPKRSLDAVLALWVVTMSLGVALSVLDLPLALAWPVAALAGLTLGGTWASDRPYMFRLSPPRYLGQFYGLYSMAGRFSAIVGPLLWAAIVDWLGWGRPAAVSTLIVMVVLAYFVLRPVSDAPRAWGPEDLPEPGPG